MSVKPMCATCVFFAAARSECRKNPPTVVTETEWEARTDEQFLVGCSRWPRVDESNWCGAWVATVGGQWMTFSDTVARIVR